MTSQQQQLPPLPSPASSDVADAKLLHLVRKLIDASETTTPSCDYIVTMLRTQNREYLRKDLNRLKAQVEGALTQILGPDASSSESRKRKLLEDEQDEKAAVENDAARERVSAGGGLNASLRDRYRQVQQTRDTTAAAAVAANVSDAAAEGATEQTGDKPPTDAATGKKKTGGTKRRGIKGRKSPAMMGMGSADGNDSAFLTPVMRPTERYSDLGGMGDVVQQIRQLVEYPLIRPELYQHLGVDPPRGVLLRGPPGTGKTHLAKAGM